MSSWKLIIVLIIAVVGAIFIPEDNQSYKEYNCYDKSIYKCGKRRKRCKWHIMWQLMQKSLFIIWRV